MNASMNTNTLTNESMREIILALVGSYPGIITADDLTAAVKLPQVKAPQQIMKPAAVQEPQTAPLAIQPKKATQKPKAQTYIDLKAEYCMEPVRINFSDLSFVSADTNKILLPYHGSFPKAFKDGITDKILKTNYNYEELSTLKQRGKTNFENIFSSPALFICLRATAERPKVALEFDYTLLNGWQRGKRIHQMLLCECDIRQGINLLNRFFNRKKTGLRPDICATYERYHIQCKRKFSI